MRASGDANVTIEGTDPHIDAFTLKDTIKSITWMDTDEAVEFTQEGDRVEVKTVPVLYGRDTVIRVAKIVCE